MEDSAAAKRKEMRERLMQGRSLLLNMGRSRPIETASQFPQKANNFNSFFDRYYDLKQNFPVETYMKEIYSKVFLLDPNRKFLSIFDSASCRTNILAVNKQVDVADILNGYDYCKKDIAETFSAKNHIWAPFTEKGCIQYLHFLLFGEEYCHDHRVVTSIEDLYVFIRESGEYFDEKQLLHLIINFRCDEDLKPMVFMYEDECIIEWCEFHRNKDISWCLYKIDKEVAKDGAIIAGNTQLSSKKILFNFPEVITIQVPSGK